MAAVHVGIQAATEENLNWLVHMVSQAHALRNNMTAPLSRKRLTTLTQRSLTLRMTDKKIHNVNLSKHF